MKYLIAFLLIASPALAGNRYSNCSTGHCATVVEQVAYPQTIIQNQQIFYSVGEQVRQYAVTPQAVALANAEAIKRRMGELQDQLAEYQTQQSYSAQAVCYVPVQAVPCAPGQQPQQTGIQQPDQPAAFNLTQPGVMQSCIKCHTKAGPARDVFDLTKRLSCEDALSAMEAVATGTMPKGGQHFNSQQLKQLKVELGEFNKRFDKPTPPQAAPADDEPVPTAPQETPEEGEKFSNATREWLRYLAKK